MEEETGRGGIAPLILKLRVIWKSAVNITLRPLYSPGTDYTKGEGEFRAGPSVLKKRETSGLRRDSKPRPSSSWSSHYTDYAIPGPN
jgi:hypothetical protein